MLRERLTRKEELLHDYENDLSKLRQAEMVIQEKNRRIQHLEVSPLVQCFDAPSLFYRQKKERKTMRLDSYAVV